MEVHHPHHPTHKKKWSEYIIEFIMLFTAVTLGVFAENIREHQVLVKKTFKSHTEALLHSLQSCRDVAYALLLENFEKSSASDVVYETWVRGFDDENDN